MKESNKRIVYGDIPEKCNNIHFIGIGGVGMSGIANLLINKGYQVSGSDLCENKLISRLKENGVIFYQGHQSENIAKADLIVLSSAISSDNPEILAARHANIPIIPRARMLAEIMQGKQNIAVTGTHGKTTTTGIVASILIDAGLDPAFAIGGSLHSADSNAQYGKGDYFVAEADESDASFLFLNPKIAIVTNIDSDHLWFYDNDFERLKQAFVQFMENLPQEGTVIACIDDPVICKLLPKIQAQAKIISYGFSDDADWQLCSFSQHGLQAQFQVRNKADGIEHVVKLNLPGEHNALNATAAMIAAYLIDIPEKTIMKSLAEYQGTSRRFQILGEYEFGKGRALIIDDYGHHPREITATLNAVKLAWPGRRFFLAFQPQRYSRTEALFDDFVMVLAQLENLIILDIYSAGEPPIEGIDGVSLCAAIQKKGNIQPYFLPRMQQIETLFAEILCDGDIVIMQGAGDVGTMAARLFKSS